MVAFRKELFYLGPLFTIWEKIEFPHSRKKIWNCSISWKTRGKRYSLQLVLS